MLSQSKKIKVLHYVWWRNAHVNSLIAEMQRNNVDARQSRALLPTSTVRILFSPLYPIGYRLLGYRIIHLHWIAGHFRPSKSTSQFMAKIFYQFFKLFLVCAQLVGIKIVWTTHNVMPHDQIFPDDVKARKYLVKHCAAIFALNQTSYQKLIDNLGAQNVHQIPVAEVVVAPDASRETTRELLRIGQDEILFSHLGNIRPYKGTDKFLTAIPNQPTRHKFLIAGSPGPVAYMENIRKIAQQVNESGTALTYREGFISDSELANFIQASDFLVCPFENINNSGFVNIAFEMGVPIILSDIEGLAWVPREAAVWIKPDNDVESLRQTIELATALSANQKSEMVIAGKEFMIGKDWSSYVMAQVQIYQTLI